MGHVSISALASVLCKFNNTISITFLRGVITGVTELFGITFSVRLWLIVNLRRQYEAESRTKVESSHHAVNDFYFKTDELSKNETCINRNTLRTKTFYDR